MYTSIYQSIPLYSKYCCVCFFLPVFVPPEQNLASNNCYSLHPTRSLVQQYHDWLIVEQRSPSFSVLFPPPLTAAAQLHRRRESLIHFLVCCRTHVWCTICVCTRFFFFKVIFVLTYLQVVRAELLYRTVQKKSFDCGDDVRKKTKHTTYRSFTLNCTYEVSK